MKYLILIIALFAYSQIKANQKIFKWTDAQGNTHYSESKPENQQTSEIKVRETKSKVVASTSKSNKPNQEPAEEPAKELTQEQKDVAEYNKKIIDQQNRENCKIAKSNLKTLQDTAPVMRKDPNTGETIYLDNSAKIKMIKDSKKSIRELCKRKSK